MSVEQKFKVGDRVRIDWAKTPYVGTHNYRNEGTVCPPTDGLFPIAVRGFCGVYDHTLTFPPEALTPTATLTPGEYAATVHPDGTVTLTPVQAAEVEQPQPEVRRQPEKGEVWQRKNGELLLRTELVSGGRNDSGIKWVAVRDQEDGAGYVWVIDPDDVTFAYPSLAAAVAAGAIK